MFEGYTGKEITDMIRNTLKDPERREKLLRLLDEMGLLPDVLPEEDQEDS